jgi:vacuolar-type H+-ATPase subunit H
MQRVWDELKKLEAQAEQIQADAKNQAKQILAFAHQESDKLVANSKVYGQQEAQKLYVQVDKEAKQNNAELLEATKKTAAKLKAQAEEHMDKAVRLVVNAVLEETSS